VSYLVYCIFRGPLPADLETPTGVGGQRVFTVNHQGLDAVLSKLAEPDSPRDTSELLVYETVVESFYRHLTVIPMRYGCRVESPREAIGLLRKNHDAYGALLHELEAWRKWVFTFSSTLPGMEWRATRGLFLQDPYPSIGILALLILPQSDSVIWAWTEPACSSASWSRRFAIRCTAPSFATKSNCLLPAEVVFCPSISSCPAIRSNPFAEPLVTIMRTNPSSYS